MLTAGNSPAAIRFLTWSNPQPSSAATFGTLNPIIQPRLRNKKKPCHQIGDTAMFNGV
ncbi:hypothetical protein RISK_004943 [Rhodopirellula islandica]|uniref:Uncharacterized protein n=1 Tax=Rhodopirellula islandica TaxID=595434 RepID=A0A0J1B8W7_RHOIS|nr:hypothetical protein RISK_004943 [Rhodopirellula islandica]